MIDTQPNPIKTTTKIFLKQIECVKIENECILLNHTSNFLINSGACLIIIIFVPPKYTDNNEHFGSYQLSILQDLPRRN